MKTLAIWAMLGATAFAAAAPQGVTQERIDEAIRRGVKYLKKAPEPTAHKNYKNADELILLALVHADVSEEDPFYKKLLKRMLAYPITKTYKVSLQAMCLEEIERVKHQLRIAECAQFLVDNQCKNGQWSYGSPTDTKIAIKGLPPIATRPEPKPKPGGMKVFGPVVKEKPKVVRTIKIRRRRDGKKAEGDNSNSQYASLGLRACHDAGIILPPDVITRAYKWWVESQHPPADGAAEADTPTGIKARPRGWCYKIPKTDDRKPTHAMTAGAVGAVCIYDHLLRRDWKKDPVANAGVAWLGTKFKVEKGNLYYMYGLERAGMLYGTPLFGGHDWYLKGAKVILEAQSGDGSWGKREPEDKARDVCLRFGRCRTSRPRRPEPSS
jgi:hypothetical protein